MKIDYSNYYWQNDLIRLRAMQLEDWKDHYYNSFDCNARRFLQSQIELPPTIKGEKELIEKFSNFNTEHGRIMFVIENLEGKNVGGFNLNSIDERNGTFSIGIQIGMKYRGKGYGTSAMRLLLQYTICLF